MSGSTDIGILVTVALTIALIGFVNWRATQLPVKRRGVFIVAYPLPLRLCALGGLLIFLWLLSPAFGIGSAVMTFHDAAILFALAAPFIAAFGFATLYYWRSRFEYDEASLTSYSALGPARHVALTDITGIGNSGVRGQEFVLNTGGRIYVSPLQRGGQTLIAFLKTQLSATNYRFERSREQKMHG